MTIYIDGTLTPVAATEAILAALDEVNAGTGLGGPDDALPATVISLNERINNGGWPREVDP